MLPLAQLLPPSHCSNLSPLLPISDIPTSVSNSQAQTEYVFVLKSGSDLQETGFHMASISSIALSGMNASQTALNASAHNIANMNADSFRRQEVVQNAQAGGGVTTTLATANTDGASLETDVVTQRQAKNAFLANLAVFNTSDKMAGALLNMKV